MRGPSILFPRKILTEVEKYLDDSGSILLVGARRVGKTSILYLLIERLKKKGVPDSNIYYFDLEEMTLLKSEKIQGFPCRKETGPRLLK